RVGIHLASTNDEPLAPQHRATVVGNLVVDNSDPTAPWHGDRFGVGIAVDGGTANVIDRNRVEGHLTAGIVLADRDTHLPDTNLVRGNVLDRNGVDLAVATPPRSPRGNCFSGNVAATSAP